MAWRTVDAVLDDQAARMASSGSPEDLPAPWIGKKISSPGAPPQATVGPWRALLRVLVNDWQNDPSAHPPKAVPNLLKALALAGWHDPALARPLLDVLTDADRVEVQGFMEAPLIRRYPPNQSRPEIKAVLMGLALPVAATGAPPRSRM